MTRKNAVLGKRANSAELRVQLSPVAEDPSHFQQRRLEVQILLTDMILKSHRRGRPKKDDGGKSNAA